MTVRTAILARAEPAAAGSSVLATVPAGEVWIIKDIRVTNNAAAAITITLNVLSADGLTSIKLAQGSINPAPTVQSVGNFVVLTAGDTINLTVSAAQLAVWLSGARLAVS